MDKTERPETRDFMSVESFSQLPFLRTSPPPLKEKSIKLFGQEFGVINTNKNFTGKSTNTQEQEDQANNNKSTDQITNTRKFECHYCCRNFPTSQALGGHQNAHKRERQNAKRAHFQTTSNNIKGHDYYMSYAPITTLPSTYHYSANNTRLNNGAHLYGSSWSSNSYHHQQQEQPINGKPLPMWRIPATPTNNNRPQIINPLFNYSKNDDRFMMKPFSAMRNYTSGLNNQRQLIGYESKLASMQDHNRHVSLDLHL